MTNITNEDRRAYAEYIAPRIVAFALRPEDILAGKHDENPGLMLLATHRQSAYAKGLADGAERERAGLVAWLRGIASIKSAKALAAAIERHAHLTALSRHVDQREGL